MVGGELQKHILYVVTAHAAKKLKLKLRLCKIMMNDHELEVRSVLKSWCWLSNEERSLDELNGNCI